MSYPRIFRNFRKVTKAAKIRNRYNQVPHITKKTTLKSDKNTIKRHTQESQEVSPFQAGDHKAVMNRQESMTRLFIQLQNIYLIVSEKRESIICVRMGCKNSSLDITISYHSANPVMPNGDPQNYFFIQHTHS